MTRSNLYLCTRARLASQSSSALLITLLTLALMTIIVVAVLSAMTWEVQSSRRSFETQKARGLTTLALHTAITQLRAALGPWDAPYGDEQGDLFKAGVPTALQGFITNAPTNYWSVSPGILTVWSYNSVAQVTNYPLFSYNPSVTNGLANLNAQAQDGTYPILGTTNALPVYWVDVLANPANPAAANNQIIGRYAFWTDDENSKININTADGVLNTGFPTNYMGAGTPTEVSLMEMTNSSGSTGTLTTAGATAMVAFARTYGFNSVRDMLHYAATTTGTAYDLYTNNLFNLTMYSRSPDFNVFGQPKMALIPANQNNYPYDNASHSVSPSSYMWNLTTFQPLKEVFPSLSGNNDVPANITGILPSVTLKDNYYTISTAGVITPTSETLLRWPLVFQTPESDGNGFNPAPGSGYCPWNNGYVIANYLAGTNVLGKSITWPEFPNATGATSYLGKYTARQIDEIAVQIVDLVSKDTSPDAAGSSFCGGTSAGYLVRGWLSGSLVDGVGRSPKVDKAEMVYTPYYNKTINTTNVPTLNATLYLETYFPSRFSGISLFHENTANGGYGVGDFIQGSPVNWQDTSGVSSATNVPNNTTYNYSQLQPGLLPKLPSPNTYSTYPAGNGGAAIGTAPTAANFSYWGNNLLQNDEGIDWNGNNPLVPDPDQTLAAKYHPYLLQTNLAPAVAGYGPNSSYSQAVATNFTVANMYLGAGYSANFQMFRMLSFVKTGHNGTLTDVLDDYAPGQYRVVMNQGAIYNSPMSTNAAVAQAVHIYGGIAVKTTVNSGHSADPDPVPLDAERGSVWLPTSIAMAGIGTAPATNIVGSEAFDNQFCESGEAFINAAGSLSPYTNVLNAVIPMSATVAVPGVSSFPTVGTPVTVYAQVKQGDILVNKFPGDWTITTNTAPANWTIALPSSTSYQSADSSHATVTLENATTRAQMTDPDAFWLPTIDNLAGLDYLFLEMGGSTVGIDPPQMPRTARFPSVGYLQYVRTGIIPDDETQPYATQHGTPYRMLSLASTASQATAQTVHSVCYPDWAMLDLFYVPSSLLSYGSPYETYAGTRTITPNTYAAAPATNMYNTPIITYSNLNAVSNMYMYGTYGGATSGRINPNGSVVYTTNMNYPTPGITRTVPLQALLHGLVYNQTQTSPYLTTYGTADSLGTNDFHYPYLTSGTAVNQATIAADIANYLSTNTYGVSGAPAPLREPAEICNIPTIAAASASANTTGTRNDLARQIIGNLTTQSNTFSIWVEAQSITKSAVNLAKDALTPANYGLYETNDQITSTVRYHFIVERDLDPGADGVYGNTALPGVDGIVGTLDDPLSGSPNFLNPASPAYFYKIIYAEEIR